MLVIFLIIIPLIGLLFTFSKVNYNINYRIKREHIDNNIMINTTGPLTIQMDQPSTEQNNDKRMASESRSKNVNINYTYIKSMALKASTVTFFVSVLIFILFDFSSNQFQYVKEYYEISSYNIYLGVDGISIYFILLTTIIMPISLISN